MKTVPFDIVASFLLGMVIPLTCPTAIKEEKSIWRTQFFLGTVLFELFFFLPLGAYLYYFYPDWSLMFFVDPGQMEAGTREGLGLVALGAYLAAVMGGFMLAARLVRQNKEGTAWLILLGVGLGLGIFSVVTFSRLMEVGDFKSWTAVPRTTTPLYAHRIGYLVGLDAGLATIVLLAMIRTFRQEVVGRSS